MKSGLNFITLQDVKVNDEEVLIGELVNSNDWEKISRMDLTHEQLRLYKDKIDWYFAINGRRKANSIPNDLLDEVISEGKLDINYSRNAELISEYHATDFEFIKKYNKYLDFGLLNKRLNLKPSQLCKLMPEIEIGTGATKIFMSDAVPYTVIEISKSGLNMKVQRDNYTPAEGYDYYSNQVYEYERNPKGTIETLRLNKFGQWVEVGGKTKFHIGSRSRHENPSF